jgi:hypothetical protein
MIERVMATVFWAMEAPKHLDLNQNSQDWADAAAAASQVSKSSGFPTFGVCWICMGDPKKKSFSLVQMISKSAFLSQKRHKERWNLYPELANLDLSRMIELYHG